MTNKPKIEVLIILKLFTGYFIEFILKMNKLYKKKVYEIQSIKMINLRIFLLLYTNQLYALLLFRKKSETKTYEKILNSNKGKYNSPKFNDKSFILYS